MLLQRDQAMLSRWFVQANNPCSGCCLDYTAANHVATECALSQGTMANCNSQISQSL